MYIYNAKIYTLDDRRPVVSALAIQDGRIAAWGEAEDIPGHLKVRPHNLGGQVLLPGLTDAHIHLEHYALGLRKIDCETATRPACLKPIPNPGSWGMAGIKTYGKAGSEPPGIWKLLLPDAQCT